MAANQEIVYIKGEREVEVTKLEATLGDIVAMECSDKNMLSKLKTIKVLKFQEQKGDRHVVSILKIIALIHSVYPNVDIENMGESDIIVCYENQKTKGMFYHVVKIGFVSVLTFIGAAFAIMTFNNDVAVSKLFSKIYEFMVGTKPQGTTILEVGYSFGISIGILLFFNHFGKKKFSVDPTPLEVQMRTYENEIQTTLIENASRRGEELDIGTSNSTGTHRS